MNFVFISPNFPAIFRFFVIRLKENGVNVLGIGDSPFDDLHPDLKEALTEYYKVDTLEDYDAVYRGVAYFAFRYGRIDWLESNNEYWLEQDAQLRTDFNIPTGLKSDQMERFKSKSHMKEFYRKAGIPVARYIMIDTLENAEAFAEEVGYPLIVKPDVGVGASATYKLKNHDDLAAFLSEPQPVPYICEEYIEGHVTTFDGVCDSNGDVIYAASHVTENSIMDMVNEHVPTFYYVTRDIPEEVWSAGTRTLKAFEASSRFFHLEFFRLTKAKEGLGEVGDIVALEVNMRPAGGYTPDMLNFAGSVDVYQIWADMVVYDRCVHDFDGPRSYCIYAGRRDEFTYVHSGADIRKTYTDHLKIVTRMPDSLADAMGNQVFIACFDSLEETRAFASYCFKEA